MVLTTRLFEEAKFTVLTPLLLLSRCRLPFPVAGLETFSLPTFALKSPNIIVILYLGEMIKKPIKCLLNHHFSSYLVHAHSE